MMQSQSAARPSPCLLRLYPINLANSTSRRFTSGQRRGQDLFNDFEHHHPPCFEKEQALPPAWEIHHDFPKLANALAANEIVFIAPEAVSSRNDLRILLEAHIIPLMQCRH